MNKKIPAPMEYELTGDTSISSILARGSGTAVDFVSGQYYRRRSDLKLSIRIRLDIDEIHPGFKVLNMLSGELIFDLPNSTFKNAGKSDISFYSTHLEVEDRADSSKKVTATVSFYTPPNTTANNFVLELLLYPTGIKDCKVRFKPWIRGYSKCLKMSDYFRNLDLQVSILKGYSLLDFELDYDTATLTKPKEAPNKILNLKEAYKDAGILLNVMPELFEVVESETFDEDHYSKSPLAWNNAELHALMEDKYPGATDSDVWPAWRAWGSLLNSYYPNAFAAGIMFDYPGDDDIQRQGFAVFKEHPWFVDLNKDCSNVRQSEVRRCKRERAFSKRQFLHTWIHELGHVFNLPHPGDRHNSSNNEALTWMNSQFHYQDFWTNFLMEFDLHDLKHLRHGDYKQIIPGWRLKETVEEQLDTAGDLFDNNNADAPLIIDLVPKEEGYDLMEQVELEVQLQNISGRKISVPTRLIPEVGVLSMLIKSPDGKIRTFHPLMHLLGDLDVRTLDTNLGIRGRNGADRISRLVNITYGKEGFYFRDPGKYELRAIYKYGKDVILSKKRTLNINKLPKHQETFVSRFYTKKMGQMLYFEASLMPQYQEQKALVNKIIDQYPRTIFSISLSPILARAEANGFQYKESLYMPNMARASALTDHVIDYYHTQPFDSQRIINLQYSRLAAERQIWNSRIPSLAGREWNQYLENMEKRGIKLELLKVIKKNRPRKLKDLSQPIFW